MKKLIITIVICSFSFLKGMEVTSTAHPSKHSSNTTESVTLLSRARQVVAELALEKYNSNGYEAFTKYLENMPIELCNELYNHIIITLNQTNIFVEELEKLYHDNPEKAVRYWNQFDLQAQILLANQLLTKKDKEILITLIRSLSEPSLHNFKFLFIFVQQLEISSTAQDIREKAAKMASASTTETDLRIAEQVESLSNRVSLTKILNKQIIDLLSKIQPEPNLKAVEPLESNINAILTQQKTIRSLIELVQDHNFEQLSYKLIVMLEYMILKKSCENIGTAKAVEEFLISYLSLDADSTNLSSELMPKLLDTRVQLVEHLYNQLAKTYPLIFELNKKLNITFKFLYHPCLYTVNYLSGMLISLFAQAILFSLDHEDENRATLLAKRALLLFTDQVLNYILELYGKVLYEEEEEIDEYEIEVHIRSLQLLLKVYAPILATHSIQSFSWLTNVLIPSVQNIISGFYSPEETKAIMVAAIEEISDIKLKQQIMQIIKL